MRLRRRLLLSTLLAPGLALGQGAPVRVEGQDFARRLELAGTVLQLNGTGVRAVAWFKGYAAALYLPSVARTAVQVLDMPGPKRLQLRMLYGVPAAEFVKALHKGVRRNAPAADHAALQAGLQALEDQVAALGQVRTGDVIDLDLDPARGLLLAVNGRPRGDAVGDATFYAAVLRSFVGEHPYDAKLRAGLLGVAVNETHH